MILSFFKVKRKRKERIFFSKFRFIIINAVIFFLIIFLWKYQNIKALSSNFGKKEGKIKKDRLTGLLAFLASQFSSHPKPLLTKFVFLNFFPFSLLKKKKKRFPPIFFFRTYKKQSSSRLLKQYLTLNYSNGILSRSSASP